MTVNRRTLVAAAGALAASPALAPPALAKETAMPRLYPVLEAIIAAWKKQDVEGVLACVTDDIVWRNSSGYAPSIKGKAAMREALTKMKAAIAPGSNKWRIFDYAESADRLFMEGVDEFDGGLRILGRAIEFGAVAGGQDRGFAHRFRPQQVVQGLAHARWVEGHLLANCQRGGMVVDAQSE